MTTLGLVFDNDAQAAFRQSLLFAFSSPPSPRHVSVPVPRARARKYSIIMVVIIITAASYTTGAKTHVELRIVLQKESVASSNSEATMITIRYTRLGR